MENYNAPPAETPPVPAPPKRTRRAGGAGREIIETLLLALAIYVAVQVIVPPYAVDGASMDPSLHDGERLLVNRPVYLHFDLNQLWNLLPGDDREEERIVYPFGQPERGDIVVFNPPNVHDKPYIKRVIGLPGETVGFADGYVTINGEPLAESYLSGPITECDNLPHCEVTVPPGTVFLLGDNRDNSSDSRLFGPVDLDRIIGKAWLTNWPLDAIGFI